MRTYSESALIVFFATMTLKGITAMRAQHSYLFHHPLMLERLRLPGCPSHVTRGRRHKALTPTLTALTEYIAGSRFAAEVGFPQRVICEDKSLFKAARPVWKPQKSFYFPTVCQSPFQYGQPANCRYIYFDNSVS